MTTQAKVKTRNRYDDLFRPDIVPIPLREDFTARVHIPLDLTKAEAAKIGNVVMAYAQGIEAGTATTAGRGPQDESPVAASDAPATIPGRSEAHE